MPSSTIFVTIIYVIEFSKVEIFINWVVKGVALLLHEITPNSEGFQSKSRVMRLGMPFVQNILMWGLSKFEIVVGNWVLNGIPSALKTHWAVLVDISKQQTFLKYILLNKASKYNIFII